MSEQYILDHLDRWSRNFEAKMRKAGRPALKGTETSRSYRRGSAKDSRFMAKEKLK